MKERTDYHTEISMLYGAGGGAALIAMGQPHVGPEIALAVMAVSVGSALGLELVGRYFEEDDSGMA